MDSDHLVHEPLARRVDHIQAAEIVEQASADGMHQMRLSDAHGAIDEQRIVAAGGHLGNRRRGGMGKLI